MAGLAPRWRVEIRSDAGLIHAAVVRAQNEGGAAHIALGQLVIGTQALRAYGPTLASFAVDVEAIE